MVLVQILEELCIFLSLNREWNFCNFSIGAIFILFLLFNNYFIGLSRLKGIKLLTLWCDLSFSIRFFNPKYVKNCNSFPIFDFSISAFKLYEIIPKAQYVIFLMLFIWRKTVTGSFVLRLATFFITVSIFIIIEVWVINDLFRFFLFCWLVIFFFFRLSHHLLVFWSLLLLLVLHTKIVS